MNVTFSAEDLQIFSEYVDKQYVCLNIIHDLLSIKQIGLITEERKEVLLKDIRQLKENLGKIEGVLNNERH